MKKMVCIVVMATVTVAGVFAQNASQRSAVIRELTGDVQLRPAGASDFSSAHAGDELAQDTIVSTGFKSTALIAVGYSVITVRPLTRLSLAEIQMSSDTESLNMSLQTGRVKVDVKPPAGTRTNFTVHSPSATASVRGTSFEFDTQTLKVIEGTVSFIGSGGIAIPVSAGSESFVGSEGNAVDPVEIANAAFQPLPPVGTDSAAGISVPPTSGEFSINLIYK